MLIAHNVIINVLLALLLLLIVILVLMLPEQLLQIVIALQGFLNKLAQLLNVANVFMDAQHVVLHLQIVLLVKIQIEIRLMDVNVKHCFGIMEVLHVNLVFISVQLVLMVQLVIVAKQIEQCQHVIVKHIILNQLLMILLVQFVILNVMNAQVQQHNAQIVLMLLEHLDLDHVIVLQDIIKTEQEL